MATSAPTNRLPKHSLRCPGCGCLDQVQRVSAVCKAGSATTRGIARTRGTFWGYGRGGTVLGSTRSTTIIDEDHATGLSQVLAPPAAPRYRHPWGPVSTLLLIAVLLSGWMAFAEAPGLHCAPGDQRTVCWDGQGSIFIETVAGVAPEPVTFARWVQGGLVALPVSIFTGLIVLRRRLGARRSRRFQADYQSWQRAYAGWQNLCYCHRCDGVFAPGERQLLSTAEWTAYSPT